MWASLPCWQFQLYILYKHAIFGVCVLCDVEVRAAWLCFSISITTHYHVPQGTTNVYILLPTPLLSHVHMHRVSYIVTST